MKNSSGCLKILTCLSCRAEWPKIRMMTASEIERVGYEPADLRVCAECETLSESIHESAPPDDGRVLFPFRKAWNMEDFA